MTPDQPKPKHDEEDWDICKQCGIMEVSKDTDFCSMECRNEWRFENGQH